MAVSMVFLWDSSLREEVYLLLLCLLSGLFSSCWVVLSSPSVEALALSSCFLFCCVWLLSLGGLLVSEGKWKGSGSGEEWGLTDARAGRGRGNCGPDVFYE